MSNQRYADRASTILMHAGIPMDATYVRALADALKAESDALVLACKQVVSWYEDSGTSDPTDATIPWRICRDVLKSRGEYNV